MTLQGFVGASDGMTRAFLAETYPALASAVATPVYLAAVLYWALFGFKVYAGHSPLQWKDFLAKAVMTAGVFAALNWGGLAQLIYDAFVSFMESAAATIMAGKPTAQMIDALYSNVDAVSRQLRTANFYQMSLLFDGFALFLANCILFVIALVYMTMAKFGLAITMVLLPLVIGFAFFEQTRHWVTNWLNVMLTSAFIYILVIAIVRFGFLAFGTQIEAAGADARANLAANNSQTGELLIIECVLILFMLGVRGWASSLAGGASTSTGTLVMIARTAMTKGVGRK
ncbi:type IV secretion system protein [Variovorax sp. M-6]|uniref:type IV secretion system protein n=1 Tax=Variovorax sp. M-6 TaxID=3233041 RepID=UPI003F9D4E3F